MTGVDWIILGVVALVALLGYGQGFVVGALSLAGFALGAFLGTRLAPHLLPDGDTSPYAPLFGLAGALLAGAVLASGFEGIGSRLRRVVRIPGLRAVDGLLGAALMGCMALGMAWVLGAVALQTPGARELRADIQRSAILTRLNTVLPSRDLLNALARFDPFPHITGPDADVAPPSSAIARDPQVAGASGSVVRVIGTACGLGVQGSGWVTDGGLVVTNAHVVAGQDDTGVQLQGEGPALPATAVRYDPTNDVAVLRVRGLDAPGLSFAAAGASGTGGAVLGFPLDGPYRVRAARLGTTQRVVTDDAYGDGPVQRTIVALRGLVQSGNSGGPMVDGRGRVVGTVFAATRTGRRGGYAVPNAIVRAAVSQASAPVSTGPCAR